MKQLTLTLLLLSSAYAGLSVAQTCDPVISTEATNSHYILDIDGVVGDKKTNLTWLRCALGQTWANNSCTGIPNLIQWEDALAKAKGLNFAGKTDWRLPTQEELQSLLEQDCDAPALDLTAFPNVPPTGVYWSSTPIAGLSGGAWTVNFYDGDDYWGYLYDYNAVRLVRNGLPEKPQPKPVAIDCSTLDSDKDGINDCNDKCPSTMTGSVVDKSGCPIVIELKGVQFELDSAILTKNSKLILDKVAKDLISYSGVKKPIEVQGHTSSEAPFDYNMRLSQRRAQSVINYLKKQGVKDKMTAKGYGETHPVVSNNTKAGKIRNRRVELHWLSH